ncbi:serine/threonine protein kinase [Solirubrobacter phytolaccae]|uniref:non-specific serine/threonine protein kinase n=1 Tax=Solirubrobacter phytolaccae TaxID=1404360 RepID=A0A9X3S9I0_9ACTN|nr:serine/threonine-protein kinase [Solirubrobacter phytolaccae]MDA0181491.1 serine/threonine protein kinase [Solirubrobacter phytolaccae]
MDTTVAYTPPWEVEKPRERPTWGLAEGDEIAPGRTVLRRIGGGRRYEALLVWDEHRLAVLVAKVLRPDQARSPVALHDLGREAELLERLAHPVVVRGFGSVVDGPFPHLVLEHLDGPTLDELLAQGGPLAIEQLLPLGLHVASALHYLANEGIVHLDVKPSNIVMGGPPRLIDLSVARELAEAAALRSPIGTDAFMAPEQCAPDGRLGPPADVFGLAATLYTGLTGARPFPPCEDRWPQLTTQAGPLPRRTPPALAEIVTAGLAPDPSARPSARDFAVALEPLVAALPRRMTLGRRG